MRNGECIQTFSGESFWPMDPRIEDIRITDIAHALSLQCRFGGHARRFYSVAQHCVIVSRIVPVQDALWGLLHDASEAYLVDLPSPIKRSSRLGEEYQAIEKNLMDVIARCFGIPIVQPESVHYADMVVLETEFRDFMGHIMFSPVYPPLPNMIQPWSPERAEEEFLLMAQYLLCQTHCKVHV